MELNPVEVAKRIRGILDENPLITASDFSAKLQKPRQWVETRLGLLRLLPAYQDMVAAGHICLSNAYCLSTLPPETQPKFVDNATTMRPADFATLVQFERRRIRTEQHFAEKIASMMCG